MIKPQDKRPAALASFHIPAALRDRIDELAMALDSEYEYVIVSVLEEYFERNKPKATKERKGKQLKRAA